MQDFFVGVGNGIINGFAATLAAVAFLLPQSPFTARSGIFGFIDADLRGYINWFLPIDWVLETIYLWVAAIFVYYAVRIVLKWVKAAAN